MRGYCGLTDVSWYRSLLAMPDLVEVNFWQPGGTTPFRALKRGEPFFFKLKKNEGNAIAGFGLFVGFYPMSILDAWSTFELSNGVQSLDEMYSRVKAYTKNARNINHEIGCVILGSVQFFPEPLWISPPEDWKHNIVQGKGYNLDRGIGKRLWTECISRSEFANPLLELGNTVAERGNPYLVTPRVGQGGFKVLVKEAYGRCAVTGEHSIPALDAAHIKAYRDGGPHSVNNGLLLRADVHRLYDRGYVSITPDYTFKVSEALNEEFAKGKIYYELEDRLIHLPSAPINYPNKDL